MRSYKQWKLLNEHLDTFVLGVKTPQSIGMDEAPMLFGMKKAKKMNTGMPNPDDALRAKPGMAMKPGMDDVPSDDEETPDMDGEEGDDDDENGMGGADETDIDSDDDEGGDDESGDDESGEEGEEGGPDMSAMGGDQAGMDRPDMSAMMGKKKKKMPPMPSDAQAMMMKKKMSYMKKEAKYMDGETDSKCCKKCDKQKKTMTKEENEFYNSLKRQCDGAVKFSQDECGFWIPVKEDHLIEPENSVEESKEPKPGEVGYAPTQKIGGIGGFQEWTNKKAKK